MPIPDDEQIECARAELIQAMHWLYRLDDPEQAGYCVEAAIERLDKVLDIPPSATALARSHYLG